MARAVASSCACKATAALPRRAERNDSSPATLSEGSLASTVWKPTSAMAAATASVVGLRKSEGGARAPLGAIKERGLVGPHRNLGAGSEKQQRVAPAQVPLHCGHIIASEGSQQLVAFPLRLHGRTRIGQGASGVIGKAAVDQRLGQDPILGKAEGSRRKLAPIGRAHEAPYILDPVVGRRGRRFRNLARHRRYPLGVVHGAPLPHFVRDVSFPEERHPEKGTLGFPREARGCHRATKARAKRRPLQGRGAPPASAVSRQRPRTLQWRKRYGE